MIKFVSAGGIIGAGDLDRITGIGQRDEVDALDDAAARHTVARLARLD